MEQDQQTPSASHPGRPRSRITRRDLELLAFVAEHRFVLAAHAWTFLGVSPGRRLRALRSAGLLSSDRPLQGPSCYSATQAGMRAVGRAYRAKAVRFGTYAHDVGLASLWLAARAGTFGQIAEVVTERAMRSRDRSERAEPEPYGVRLGGWRQPHYPDMLLITPNGKRIAFELELSAKGRRRREEILSSYGADRRIDAVVYLVQNRSLGRTIQASARRLGISNMVHVQLVTGLPQTAAPARTAARASGRQGPGAARASSRRTTEAAR